MLALLPPSQICNFRKPGTDRHVQFTVRTVPETGSPAAIPRKLRPLAQRRPRCNERELERLRQALDSAKGAYTHIIAAAEYRNVSRLRWRPDCARAGFSRSEVGSPGTFIVPTRFAADADGDGRISAAEVDFGFTRALLDPGCGNPANAGNTDPTEPDERSVG